MYPSEEPKKWGNSRENAIRRLKKFRPHLLEKVEKGELSYSQAMIQAGLKSKSAQFNPDSSQSVIVAILRHYNREQIQDISVKIKEASEGDSNNDLW